jgi:hypothetical protein
MKCGEINKTTELMEEIFTCEELALIMKFDATTVRKMFGAEPGVIRMGHPGTRKRRQYYSLRIPKSVVERVLGRMTVTA